MTTPVLPDLHEHHLWLGVRFGGCRECYPTDTGHEAWYEAARNERLPGYAVGGLPIPDHSDSPSDTRAGEAIPPSPAGPRVRQAAGSVV